MRNIGIHYHEVEKLFKAWPTLKAIVESLMVDMGFLKDKNTLGDDEEYIYDMVVGNKALNNMPPAGKIGDSTCSVATSYEKVMKFDRKGIGSEIKEEYFIIAPVLDKLSIAFRQLTELQREILEEFYWEDKSWKEALLIVNAGNGRYISESTAKAERGRAIKKMAVILEKAISHETYKVVMKMAGDE